jgi:hypothetical protein
LNLLLWRCVSSHTTTAATWRSRIGGVATTLMLRAMLGCSQMSNALLWLVVALASCSPSKVPDAGSHFGDAGQPQLDASTPDAASGADSGPRCSIQAELDAVPAPRVDCGNRSITTCGGNHADAAFAPLHDCILDALDAGRSFVATWEISTCGWTNKYAFTASAGHRLAYYFQDRPDDAGSTFIARSPCDAIVPAAPTCDLSASPCIACITDVIGGCVTRTP